MEATVNETAAQAQPVVSRQRADYIVDFRNICRKFDLVEVKAQLQSSEEYGESVYIEAKTPGAEAPAARSWFPVSARKGTKFEGIVESLRSLGLLENDEIATIVSNFKFSKLAEVMVERINSQRYFSAEEKKGIGAARGKTLMLTALQAPEVDHDASATGPTEDDARALESIY